MNSQKGLRNTIQNMARQKRCVQPAQSRQEIPAHRNFPEIRNAIAAFPDKSVPQTKAKTPTMTPSHATPPRDPASILSKCAVCTKVANFLCSGCQKVYYCTVQCQRNHWLSHYGKCSAART